jgi:glycogen debranching enzyme
MDAKRDGVVFTPRHGKPVEINALWYNALRAIAKIIATDQPGLSAELTKLADLTGQSIRAKFWNPLRSCLYDCLAPDGTPAGEIRVNQIFAVSLPHSALDDAQKLAVVKAVRDTLNTPHGVRTLEPADGRYRGRYRGRMFDRDASYHNGTAWPWLLGPLAEAELRAGKFSPQAIMHARAVLQPIVDWLTAGLCPGQIPEVVDGDDTPQEPQRPGGCPAQAWSVAEVLRVWGLIARSEAEQRK